MQYADQKQKKMSTDDFMNPLSKSIVKNLCEELLFLRIFKTSLTKVATYFHILIQELDMHICMFAL